MEKSTSTEVQNQGTLFKFLIEKYMYASTDLHSFKRSFPKGLEKTVAITV